MESLHILIRSKNLTACLLAVLKKIFADSYELFASDIRLSERSFFPLNRSLGVAWSRILFGEALTEWDSKSKRFKVWRGAMRAWRMPRSQIEF